MKELIKQLELRKDLAELHNFLDKSEIVGYLCFYIDAYKLTIVQGN